ncbi:phage portal protein [Enterococcus faecium]|uniref:hypothetical protein n=1 Tax=Enterococcus faecium TaxID=1352 RepID=UPI0019225D5D|nr:hypothetical protein [Enterococcus faecium]EGP4894204.1 phage portal protein [Enterococcus faecium]EHK9936760.1 hypothetical protein [Enterococcus faecium]MBL3708352.1 hypothetical protein [Enterococcus faecium]
MKNACEYCDKYRCHGECTNYLLMMAERLRKDGNKTDIDALKCLFKEIPKFNYALEMKVNAIFGTDLELVNDVGSIDEDKINIFNSFLYATNDNGKTNLYEIKSAIKDKEIYGEGYLFFDNKNLYVIPKISITMFQEDNEDPIVNKPLYYTIGLVEVPEKLVFPEDGFIKQDKGYIISPENIIKFSSDSYVLNSDLKQLQILLEINRKLCDSTTKRDYGDIFLLTDKNAHTMISAVADRIKHTAEDAIKKMREVIAEKLKKNKVEDSNVIVLDENYKDVKQVQPVTLVKDYKFIWEKQDDIIASAFNFPAILLGLGESSGNISKEALIRDARANALTPLKQDTENVLNKITNKIFGKGVHLRFADYEPIDVPETLPEKQKDDK